jgi:hypothetical protein
VGRCQGPSSVHALFFHGAHQADGIAAGRGCVAIAWLKLLVQGFSLINPLAAISCSSANGAIHHLEAWSGVAEQKGNVHDFHFWVPCCPAGRWRCDHVLVPVLHG